MDTTTEVRRLAIIGGGQLGMYLCQAARDLGVRSVIVTPDPQAPALTVADVGLVEALEADGLAARIAAEADVVTFEIEQVPDKLLDALDRLQRDGVLSVRPDGAVLDLLKNKAMQKQWLQDSRFPTLPFRVVADPVGERDTLVGEFGLPLVQKAQTGGYDGYGVQIVRDPTELWPVPSVIERYLVRPTELAVVVARSVGGQTRTYPPVRMSFDAERNVLDTVVVPTGFGAELDRRAEVLAGDIVTALDGVGVFAVEMFHDPVDGLIVNEISPRVHNSGHITLETARVSQFEQHVRAVCGLPLDDPGGSPPAAVMRNLLYADELEFMLDCTRGPLILNHAGTHLYWYGKLEPRSGRKMGHMTCLSSDQGHAIRRMDSLLERIRRPVTEAAA